MNRSHLRRRHGAARYALAGAWACLLLAALPRHWLEAAMWRHMLLQLPLLVAAGCLLAIALGTGPSRHRLRRAAIADQHGITGLSAALFISAYWMIPRALEQSINLPLSEAAKFASLPLAGLLLAGSLRRASPVIQLFFLGNFCWMTAIAGMQYQNLPQRLCNAYLLDDQLATGAGLVAASIAIATAWCALHAKALLSNPDEPTTHATTGT